MRQPVATSWGTACNNTPAASSSKTRPVSWHHTGPTDTRSVSDEGGRPCDIKAHENSIEAHSTLLVMGSRDRFRRGQNSAETQCVGGWPPAFQPRPLPQGHPGGGVGGGTRKDASELDAAAEREPQFAGDSRSH